MIHVNNVPRPDLEGSTIARCIETLGYDPARVAVECSEQIVPRATWVTRMIKEGDRLEIVQFMGGG